MSALLRGTAYQLKEGAYRDAFRYYDKDGDGVISYTELDEILRSLGRCLTREEMKRLLFSLDPSAITEQDFLNVMASNVVARHKLPTSEIVDAFQLYNAAKHNKPSSTANGHLDVHDNDLIMREDWQKFTTEYLRPLNVKSKGAKDLAFIPPYTYVEVPRDSVDCFEGHRVDYRQYVRSLKVMVGPKDRRREILQAFKLFNHVYRNHKASSVDSELLVQDNDMILREDMLRIMTTMGQPLTDREQAAFFENAEKFADNDSINYVKLVKSIV